MTLYSKIVTGIILLILVFNVFLVRHNWSRPQIQCDQRSHQILIWKDTVIQGTLDEKKYPGLCVWKTRTYSNAL